MSGIRIMPDVSAEWVGRALRDADEGISSEDYGVCAPFRAQACACTVAMLCVRREWPRMRKQDAIEESERVAREVMADAGILWPPDTLLRQLMLSIWPGMTGYLKEARA